MGKESTRRGWLKHLLGGLFGLGAAGATGEQVFPAAAPPTVRPDPTAAFGRSGLLYCTYLGGTGRAVPPRAARPDGHGPS